MKRIPKLLGALTGIGLAIGLLSSPAARADDSPNSNCHINGNTDSGSGGTQVQQCDNSLSVGVGGPIKDVDVAHPVGKGKAFIPQAGRDAQGVVQQGGHAAEDGAHWVGDRLGVHF